MGSRVVRLDLGGKRISSTTLKMSTQFQKDEMNGMKTHCKFILKKNMSDIFVSVDLSKQHCYLSQSKCQYAAFSYKGVESFVSVTSYGEIHVFSPLNHHTCSEVCVCLNVGAVILPV